MYCSNDDIKKLGTILGVWAHPDDEAWTSAGIMCQAVRNGQRVVCVTATCGEAGETADENRWPKKNLGEIRCKELDKAMEIIGVDDHSMLSYKDGHLPEVDEAEAVSRVAAIIEDIRPDTILTFGPDGITGHPDHKTMYTWACAAARQANSPAHIYCATETSERYEAAGKKVDAEANIYFATDKPLTVPEADVDLCLKLDDSLVEMKENALRAQASQTERMLTDETMKDIVHIMLTTESFVKAGL